MADRLAAKALETSICWRPLENPPGVHLGKNLDSASFRASFSFEVYGGKRQDLTVIS